MLSNCIKTWILKQLASSSNWPCRVYGHLGSIRPLSQTFEIGDASATYMYYV